MFPKVVWLEKTKGRGKKEQNERAQMILKYITSVWGKDIRKCTENC
jgi:hypothetical protein